MKKIFWKLYKKKINRSIWILNIEIHIIISRLKNLSNLYELERKTLMSSLFFEFFLQIFVQIFQSTFLPQEKNLSIRLYKKFSQETFLVTSTITSRWNPVPILMNKRWSVFDCFEILPIDSAIQSVGSTKRWLVHNIKC